MSKVAAILSLISVVSMACQSHSESKVAGLSDKSPPVMTTSKLNPCALQQKVWNAMTAPGQIYKKPLPKMKGMAWIAGNFGRDITAASETFRQNDKSYDGEELRKEGVFKKRRHKIVHRYGSVAKIEWVPSENSHRYTGLFETGAPCGFVRFGLTAAPRKDEYVPGSAFKFYLKSVVHDKARLPQKSVNIFAMDSIDGQKSRNFFERKFSNILPQPKKVPQKVIGQYFKQAARPIKPVNPNPMVLELDHFAGAHHRGKVVTPKKMEFVPTPEAQEFFVNAGDDPRPVFEKMPQGTTLYQIFLYDSESPGPSEKGAYAGKIVTRSPFINSRYGDEVLHFRHYKKRR